MPWTCCGAEILDVYDTCPGCGTQKRKWTMRFKSTRRFVVPLKVARVTELEVDEPPVLEAGVEWEDPTVLACSVTFALPTLGEGPPSFGVGVTVDPTPPADQPPSFGVGATITRALPSEQPFRAAVSSQVA